MNITNLRGPMVNINAFLPNNRESLTPDFMRQKYEVQPDEILVQIFNELGRPTHVISLRRLLKSKSYLNIIPEFYPVHQAIVQTLTPSDGVMTWLNRISVDKVDNDPITVFEMDDGYYYVMDGQHRYIKAYMIDREEIIARYVPRTLWSQFIVQVDHRDLQLESTYSIKG